MNYCFRLLSIFILSVFTLNDNIRSEQSDDDEIYSTGGSLGYANKITRFNITWYFDKEYEYGQFVNGDYWVLGPVKIINIDPKSTNTDGQISHGSMLNPIYGESQAYDSNPYLSSNFDSEKNVGRPNQDDISSANPLLLEPGSSLVSTRTQPGVLPHVIDASVLTVLDSLPPQGSFRPPYSGTDKTPYWNISDIKWDLLPGLKEIPRSVRPVSELEERVEKTWIDHAGGTWIGREIHPSNNMPDYGGAIARTTAVIGLTLLLDYPKSEIETLMIRYLQLGIDWYGITDSSPDRFGGVGGMWWGNGGHGLGRKWPVMFTGIMLGDPVFLNYTHAGGYRHRWDNPDWEGEPGYPIFQDSQQFFIITQHDVDQPRYQHATRVYAPYTVDMIGLPEFGTHHVNNPSRDASNWDSYYRSIVSNAMAGHVLAAHIMDAKELWGWDPIFDYLDRWVAADEAGEHNFWSGHVANQPDGIVRDMWNLYRADLSVSVKSTKDGLVESFHLSQNYPNPFNPVTTIKYALPYESGVSIVVYDIMGREVATLVDEVKSSGSYSVEWDGRNYNGVNVGSGVYFYQLKTDIGYIQIKRMLKLK